MRFAKALLLGAALLLVSGALSAGDQMTTPATAAARRAAAKTLKKQKAKPKKSAWRIPMALPEDAATTVYKEVSSKACWRIPMALPEPVAASAPAAIDQGTPGISSSRAGRCSLSGFPGPLVYTGNAMEFLGGDGTVTLENEAVLMRMTNGRLRTLRF